MARRRKPPGLNQLRSVYLLQKWNVHLMSSVAVQRLSGMSPGEAGRPGQDRAAQEGPAGPTPRGVGPGLLAEALSSSAGLNSCGCFPRGRKGRKE